MRCCLNENTMLMSAVGNNGTVYTLEKLPNYEAAKVTHKYRAALEYMPDPTADPEGYISFIDQFYYSLREYGFIYRKG